MSGLDFLKKVQLKSNSEVKAPTARTSSAVAKNPEKAHIRIYKNGAVYPSQKLVDKCNLQFVAKDAEVKGNGFDVFSSKDFLNTKHLDTSVIFIAMVPKDAGKVDLFNSTKYNEDGSPMADVLTQGAATAGAAILELIENVYGVTIPQGENFIDLMIVTENPLNTDDNIYYVPKVVSRGEKKGQVDLVRRENLTLYPLVPLSLIEGNDEAPTEEETKEEAGSLSEIEAEGAVETEEVIAEETEETFSLEGDVEEAGEEQ